jgi:hypothetical protein
MDQGIDPKTRTFERKVSVAKQQKPSRCCQVAPAPTHIRSIHCSHQTCLHSHVAYPSQARTLGYGDIHITPDYWLQPIKLASLEPPQQIRCAPAHQDDPQQLEGTLQAAYGGSSMQPYPSTLMASLSHSSLRGQLSKGALGGSLSKVRGHNPGDKEPSLGRPGVKPAGLQFLVTSKNTCRQKHVQQQQ